MIRKRGLPPVFWILFGLLSVSGFAIALGDRESSREPSVTNYGASGVSALFTLLQQEGYNVESTQATNPPLRSNDVAVCFREAKGKANENDPFQADLQDDPAPPEPFKRNLTKFLQKGGRAVSFTFSQAQSDNDQPQKAVEPIEVHNKVVPQKLSVILDLNDTTDDDLPVDHLSQIRDSMWLAKDQAVVWASKVGKGELVVSNSSFPTSNRYIDKADDARFTLATIDLVARPGDRIVFTEASFGNVSDPGFFERVGTWALAAWRQIVVLFSVLIVSLGKRFGYPEERRKHVQSSRDLANAYGNLLFRARRVDISLMTAHNRLDAKLRSQYRIPKDASDGERDRLLPEEVTKSLSQLMQAAKVGTTKPSEALRLIRATELAIDTSHNSVTHMRGS
jgi:hypothetical protein